MRARVTPEDLAGGKLVKPDWYACEIADYQEKPANTDQSTNGFFHFKIISGENAGARARRMVNEKAWGFSPNPNLLYALGAQAKPGVGLDVAITKESVVGKKLEVYIARGRSDKGTEYNDPLDFAPLGTNIK